MTLELKHLAPYLPYGLKFKSEYGIEVMYSCRTNMLPKYENQVVVSVNRVEEKTLRPDVDGSKPILHPLSDLTKEIDHNGESFVPLIELAKNYAFDGGIRNNSISLDEYSQAAIWTKDNGYMRYFAIAHEEDKYGVTNEIYFRLCEAGLDEKKLRFVPDFKKPIRPRSVLGMYIKIFEWHFDVFGLIDAGLAIDINTI